VRNDGGGQRDLHLSAAVQASSPLSVGEWNRADISCHCFFRSVLILVRMVVMFRLTAKKRRRLGDVGDGMKNDGVFPLPPRCKVYVLAGGSGVEHDGEQA